MVFQGQGHAVGARIVRAGGQPIHDPAQAVLEAEAFLGVAAEDAQGADLQAIRYVNALFQIFQLAVAHFRIWLEEVVADGVDRQRQTHVGDLALDLWQFRRLVPPEVIEQLDALGAVSLLGRGEFHETAQVHLTCLDDGDDAPHADTELHSSSFLCVSSFLRVFVSAFWPVSRHTLETREPKTA